ncbi:tetratricopeptide repeat protein 19 homolog, mitochondrial isoform X1 [Drosophila guanche]|uniref:Blast:Tetratricopeptide repeat protein 19 homolog, mitochondrial n=1 Tax=Drosophila guanche TaxID=7266 RepID=A0A3B0JYR4_DROGU|nr:tetratricopeptide repeat protein 19 homolog, mitochondrial isoform X1 [Drosophila guanche]SPP86213.1 blast:Tetratricopeptide repeat protein 19 homolog%2C mitochondrial [Drosophila guanche]
MIVTNISKLSQVMARLRVGPNPREYCQLAKFRRTNQQQRSESTSLCPDVGRQHHHGTGSASGNAYRGTALAFTTAFTFNLFGNSDKDKEESPEEKLINMIKRSILCVQREQYDKAEQMLHLALRMAQDLQSKDGITYVYDVMANLAMEREQFIKAEKIFTDVMKRLFADGYTEESPKILHISSKIAHMSQLQGDLEKSSQGFIWTLQQLAKLVEKMPEDKDVQELYGLTKNWFGQLLMKQGKYTEAKNLFKEAFDTLCEVYGAVNDASVTILNNISVAYVNLENYAEAKATLQQAMALAKELNDVSQEGVLMANLGLVYLREGLMEQAEKSCKLAWKMGQQHKNPDAIEQAEYCLNEIKATINGAKGQ